MDYSVPLEESVDKEPPGRPAECDIFLVLLGYRSLGCAQLLETLMNQQAKYECGQDPQPEGGGQGTGAAH